MNTDRRTNKTKTAIKKALLELVIEKDCSKITVTELASRANIGRKTFYLHYQGVSDIVKDLQEDYQNYLCQRVEEHIKETKTNDIHDIILEINKIILAQKDYFEKIIKSDTYALFQESAKVILKSALVLFLSNHYVIREEDMPFFCDFYSSGLVSIYTNWLKNPKAISLDQLTIIANKVCFIGGEALLKSAKI